MSIFLKTQLVVDVGSWRQSPACVASERDSGVAKGAPMARQKK